MALVDLSRDDPEAVALIARIPALGAAATGNSKLIGWDEDGEITAAVVAVRRDDAIEVRYIAVLPELREHGSGRALLTTLADVVNAAELTAEADAETVGFFRACGFEAMPLERPGREIFKCILPIEAVPSPEAHNAVTLEALEGAVAVRGGPIPPTTRPPGRSRIPPATTATSLLSLFASSSAARS